MSEVILFTRCVVEQLAGVVGRYASGQVLVVTDTHTRAMAAGILPAGLSDDQIVVLPVGEEHKSLAEVEAIWQALHCRNITRHGLLVCIGGGRVTDIGGFAAATYKRGMAYINIPTTLLAMVDASTGGKTGVNYMGAKNEIGCFYPPRQTLIDTRWLRTLDAREWLSGWAEMLKHGLIHSKETWRRLLAFDLRGYFSVGDVSMPMEEELGRLIEESVGIKAEVVRRDPHERGRRMVLNFGHTIGHALEVHLLDMGQPIPHGYAVVYGMIGELYLSVVHRGMATDALQALTSMMVEYYGKIQCACKDRQAIVKRMYADKKNMDSERITFTLLRDIGQAEVNIQLGEKEIEEALEYLFSL